MMPKGAASGEQDRRGKCSGSACLKNVPASCFASARADSVAECHLAYAKNGRFRRTSSR
jgi:hypothetical protein